jgi:hypothetical protein
VPEDNSRFIVAAAKARHRRSVERVVAVLRDFDHDGVPVNFAAVAAAASVSRAWLYREPALRAEIVRCRSCSPAKGKPLVPAAQRATAESQRQKMDALNQQLRSARDENARLRAELEQSLGQQRLANATRRPVATIPTSVTCNPRRPPDRTARFGKGSR